ncbi:MAG: leuA 6 [Anaerosporomusa subterranea]|nr:leuA 6 [Anaerosporomusa subterranea]
MLPTKRVAETKAVYLVDTTLRDGEQTAGVVFSHQEKVRIAQLLDEIGVEQIEAGIPIMGKEESDAIKAIVRLNLQASILGWARAAISDVQACIACGVDAVEISSPTSDIHIQHKLRSSREAVLENTVKAVEYAKREGLYISVGAEDASRSDNSFLLQYAQAVKQAGAQRLRYCDTIGLLNPIAVFEQIKWLREQIDIDIEIHTHNDFGMATANAVAGFLGGARFIDCTVNGLGERAGNAALEEVIFALRQTCQMNLPYDSTKLRPLCEFTAKASDRTLPVDKAIVGSNVFHHESGIHTNGILKSHSLYEAFAPEEVGLKRKIIIGKHSGTSAVEHRLQSLGILAESGFAAYLLPQIRAKAVELKRSPSPAELDRLVAEWLPRYEQQSHANKHLT